MDLIGKTISGAIAVPGSGPGQPHRIWLLQFTDGTHVEFVSPRAQRDLSRLAGSSRRVRRGGPDSPQLSLEVA